MNQLTKQDTSYLVRNFVPLLPARIENLQAALSHVESDDQIIYARSVSQNVSGMPHGSGTSDKVANMAFTEQAVQGAETSEIVAELSACRNLKTQFDSSMQFLPDVQRKVVDMFGIKHMKYSEIADTLRYSDTYCKEIYYKGIDGIRKTLYLLPSEFLAITGRNPDVIGK